MQELLSVLLYLSLICSPCSYYVNEIEAITEDNQENVDDIMDDVQYLESVVDEFGEIAGGVTIVDWDEEY